MDLHEISISAPLAIAILTTFAVFWLLFRRFSFLVGGVMDFQGAPPMSWPLALFLALLLVGLWFALRRR